MEKRIVIIFNQKWKDHGKSYHKTAETEPEQVLDNS